MSKKPILCVDFDGVIHSYTSPWQGVDKIPDPPVPGALAWLRRCVQHFEVHIYSSRSKGQAGREAMCDYLRINAQREFAPAMSATQLDLPTEAVENLDAFVHELHFSSEKPPAFLTVDDRAVVFNGRFDVLEPSWLLKFKPWNKREVHYPVPLGGDHVAAERDLVALPPHQRPDWPLPSFDARDWATAFVRVIEQIKPDEEFMLTWFSNALMRGYDQRSAEFHVPDVNVEVARLMRRLSSDIQQGIGIAASARLHRMLDNWSAMLEARDMGDVIYSPWTSEQVDALNRWQRSPYVHPFECVEPHEGHDRALLATTEGWVCPHCNYCQEWAHRSMLEEPFGLRPVR